MAVIATANKPMISESYGKPFFAYLLYLALVLALKFSDSSVPPMIALGMHAGAYLTVVAVVILLHWEGLLAHARSRRVKRPLVFWSALIGILLAVFSIELLGEENTFARWNHVQLWFDQGVPALLLLIVYGFVVPIAETLLFLGVLFPAIHNLFTIAVGVLDAVLVTGNPSWATHLWRLWKKWTADEDDLDMQHVLTKGIVALIAFASLGLIPFLIVWFYRKHILLLYPLMMYLIYAWIVLAWMLVR